MPLDLVPNKDFNGLLCVEMVTSSTENRFTIPCKPIFYDIDITSEIAAAKAKTDAFSKGTEHSTVWSLSEHVEGLYTGLTRSGEGKIKASIYY